MLEIIQILIFVLLQSVEGTMTLLEITNRLEARPMIEQIDVTYRSLAPNIMLYVSLKGIVGIILNIVVLFFVTLTGWEVVDSSKRENAMKFIAEEQSEQKTVNYQQFCEIE